MEIFSAFLAISAGNSPAIGEFPTQRSVPRSFDVFFDLRMNKRLSKQWWSWGFETPSCPLSRHCNVTTWKHFTRHFGEGSTVIFARGQICRRFDIFFVHHSNTLLNNRSSFRWFETPRYVTSTLMGCCAGASSPGVTLVPILHLERKLHAQMKTF